MSNKMHSFLFALGYTLSFGSTQSLRLNSSEMPHKNHLVQSLCNGFFSICKLKCHREPNCLQNCTMCLALTSCYASLLMYSIGCESFPNHTITHLNQLELFNFLIVFLLRIFKYIFHVQNVFRRFALSKWHLNLLHVLKFCGRKKKSSKASYLCAWKQKIPYPFRVFFLFHFIMTLHMETRKSF